MVIHQSTDIYITDQTADMKPVIKKHFCYFNAASLPALSLGVQLIYVLNGVCEKDSIFANLHPFSIEITHLEREMGVLADGVRIVQFGSQYGRFPKGRKSSGQGVDLIPF